MIPRILFEIPDPEMYRNRYDLGRPFVEGEWLVATDGRIMARVALASLGPGERAPYERGTRKLLAPGRAMQVWDEGMRCPRVKAIALPGPVIRDREACPCCHPGSAWEWPFIPPSGRYCEECDGEGWLWVCDGIDLGSAVINPRYAALLLRHGVSGVVPADDPGRPVYFAGEGFEGLLQPYDPKMVRAGAA